MKDRKWSVVMRVLLAALVCVALACPTIAAAKAEFTMRMQTAWPSAFTLNVVAKQLAKQIENNSKGRIKVEFNTAGQIVPGMECWDAVSKGIIDATHICTCYTIGKSWASAFFCNGVSMPPPAVKALWMYEGGGNEIANKILSKYYKVQVFPAMVISEAWAYSNSEINSLDDLRKLKMRASGIRAATLKNLGVAVVTLPGGEIIPAMQKGVIDAFEFSALSYDQSFGVDQVVKYIYYSPIVDGGTPFLVMNKDWWNKLPKDLKKAVRDAAYETTMFTLGFAAMGELRAMEDSTRRFKTTIKWLPPDVSEALIKSAKELIEKRRKTDPEMQMIMESLDAFMAKYGKFVQFRSNMF